MHEWQADTGAGAGVFTSDGQAYPTCEETYADNSIGSGLNTVRLARLNLIKSMTYGIFSVRNDA